MLIVANGEVTMPTFPDGSPVREAKRPRRREPKDMRRERKRREAAETRRQVANYLDDVDGDYDEC